MPVHASAGRSVWAGGSYTASPRIGPWELLAWGPSNPAVADAVGSVINAASPGWVRSKDSLIPLSDGQPLNSLYHHIYYR